MSYAPPNSVDEPGYLTCGHLEARRVVPHRLWCVVLGDLARVPEEHLEGLAVVESRDDRVLRRPPCPDRRLPISRNHDRDARRPGGAQPSGRGRIRQVIPAKPARSCVFNQARVPATVSPSFRTSRRTGSSLPRAASSLAVNCRGRTSLPTHRVTSDTNSSTWPSQSSSDTASGRTRSRSRSLSTVIEPRAVEPNTAAYTGATSQDVSAPAPVSVRPVGAIRPGVTSDGVYVTKRGCSGSIRRPTRLRARTRLGCRWTDGPARDPSVAKSTFVRWSSAWSRPARPSLSFEAGPLPVLRYGLRTSSLRRAIVRMRGSCVCGADPTTSGRIISIMNASSCDRMWQCHTEVPPML